MQSSDVPNTVRRFREKKRWTLERLADLAGTTKAHLSKIERGLVVPNGITRENIADALGVPRDLLFFDEPAEAAG